MTHTLTLTPTEINIILDCLTAGQYRTVAPVIEKIIEQVRASEQAEADKQAEAELTETLPE